MRRPYLAAAAALLLACTRSSATGPATARGGPIDRQATAETRALFFNLRRLAREHVLFGHQDDLAYGYDWVAEPGRSDVRESSGSYPAVYGWEVSGLETASPKNIDGERRVETRRVRDGVAQRQSRDAQRRALLRPLPRAFERTRFSPAEGGPAVPVRGRAPGSLPARRHSVTPPRSGPHPS